MTSLFMKSVATRLWYHFGTIPIDEEETIEEMFLDFEPGTHREDIWHWFEEFFDLNVHDDLMFPE